MALRVVLEGRRWEVKCCHNPRLQVQLINKSSAAGWVGGRKEGVIDLEVGGGWGGIFHRKRKQS